MKKTNGISISKSITHPKTETDKNATSDTQKEFSEDWKKQMALKNEAILKSIEELIDKSLSGKQD